MELGAYTGWVRVDPWLDRGCWHCCYSTVLTGTPVQNNLLELWSLLHWLYPSVFTRATENLFKASFDLSRGSYSIPFLNQLRLTSERCYTLHTRSHVWYLGAQQLSKLLNHLERNTYRLPNVTYLFVRVESRYAWKRSKTWIRNGTNHSPCKGKPVWISYR